MLNASPPRKKSAGRKRLPLFDLLCRFVGSAIACWVILAVIQLSPRLTEPSLTAFYGAVVAVILGVVVLIPRLMRGSRAVLPRSVTLGWPRVSRW